MSDETAPLSAVRVESVFSCREEMERAQRLRVHREDAARLGMTEQELWRRKHILRIAFEEGGGWEGARARLKFAQEFLDKKSSISGKP